MGFNSGLILCWNTTPLVVGTTINLPISYSSNYTCVIGIVSYTGVSGMGAHILCCTKTLTTVRLGNNKNYQGIKVTFMSIGY